MGLFSKSLANKQKRMLLKNGHWAVQHHMPQRESRVLTQTLLRLMKLRLSYLVLLYFLLMTDVWLTFAMIWWVLAILRGDLSHTRALNHVPCVVNMTDFTDAMLFSMEVQYSAGYGTRHPTGRCPEVFVLLGVQSAFGNLIIAAACAVLVGKMMRPNKRDKHLRFSKKAVICQREGELTLMFRVSGLHKQPLIHAVARGFLVKRHVTKESLVEPMEQFAIDFGRADGTERLLMAWPVIVKHVIDQDSPLWNISADTLTVAQFELFVLVEGVSATSGMPVQGLTSYMANEVMWGYRFADMFGRHGNSLGIRYRKFDSLVFSKDTPKISARDLAFQNPSQQVNKKLKRQPWLRKQQRKQQQNQPMSMATAAQAFPLVQAGAGMPGQIMATAPMVAAAMPGAPGTASQGTGISAAKSEWDDDADERKEMKQIRMRKAREDEKREKLHWKEHVDMEKKQWKEHEEREKLRMKLKRQHAIREARHWKEHEQRERKHWIDHVRREKRRWKVRDAKAGTKAQSKLAKEEMDNKHIKGHAARERRHWDLHEERERKKWEAQDKKETKHWKEQQARKKQLWEEEDEQKKKLIKEEDARKQRELDKQLEKERKIKLREEELEAKRKVKEAQMEKDEREDRAARRHYCTLCTPPCNYCLKMPCSCPPKQIPTAAIMRCCCKEPECCCENAEQCCFMSLRGCNKSNVAENKSNSGNNVNESHNALTGGQNLANSNCSKSNGSRNKSNGSCNKSIGSRNKSNGSCNKSIGSRNKSNGSCSKSHGSRNKSIGSCNKSIGSRNKSNGSCNKSIGSRNKSNGSCNKSIGSRNKSNGSCSKSHGSCSKSHGSCSKSHSSRNKSNGSCSRSHGQQPDNSCNKSTSGQSKGCGSKANCCSAVATTCCGQVPNCCCASLTARPDPDCKMLTFCHLRKNEGNSNSFCCNKQSHCCCAESEESQSDPPPPKIIGCGCGSRDCCCIQESCCCGKSLRCSNRRGCCCLKPNCICQRSGNNKMKQICCQCRMPYKQCICSYTSADDELIQRDKEDSSNSSERRRCHCDKIDCRHQKSGGHHCDCCCEKPDCSRRRRHLAAGSSLPQLASLHLRLPHASSAPLLSPLPAHSPEPSPAPLPEPSSARQTATYPARLPERASVAVPSPEFRIALSAACQLPPSPEHLSAPPPARLTSRSSAPQLALSPSTGPVMNSAACHTNRSAALLSTPVPTHLPAPLSLPQLAHASATSVAPSAPADCNAPTDEANKRIEDTDVLERT